MHLAGQIGLVPGTMQLVEGGAEAEARLALRHAFRALEAVGTGAKEIVQVSGTGRSVVRFVQWREFRNLSETALTPRKAIASLLLLKDNNHVSLRVRPWGTNCMPDSRPYRTTSLRIRRRSERYTYVQEALRLLLCLTGPTVTAFRTYKGSLYFAAIYIFLSNNKEWFILQLQISSPHPDPSQPPKWRCLTLSAIMFPVSCYICDRRTSPRE